MENLQIEKTKYTMGIDFNSEIGVMEMTGSSYPDNALEFFSPILNWINDYITQLK